MKSIQSNIWKYTVLSITRNRVYHSILAAYLLMFPGTTANSVGLMLFIGSMASVVMEVPSGYLSDKIGHKQALVLASVFVLSGSMLFAVAQSFEYFIVASICASIGLAFQSGTGAAFMHETLLCLKREHEYSHIMGKINAIKFGVIVPLLILIPLSIDINFRLPFYLVVLLDFLGLIISLALTEPNKSKVVIDEINQSNFKAVVKEVKKRNITFVLFIFALLSAFIITNSSFRSAYQFDLGIPVLYYGIFLSISRVIIAILSYYNYAIKKILTIHQFIVSKVLIFFCILLILGLTNNLTIVVLTYILGSSLNSGTIEIENHFLFDQIGESKFKATILSLRGLFTQLIYGISSLIFGVIVVLFGYMTSYLYSAFLLLFFLGSLFLFYYYQRMNQRNINDIDL